MNRLLVLLFWVLMALPGRAQSLYVRTFGDATANPVIFLHGGPGYNCANFEATTARPLADRGYFVIVYDRRGEGRSPDKKAAFTFAETFADLNSLYARFGLRKATLIGHSFGGISVSRPGYGFNAGIGSGVYAGNIPHHSGPLQSHLSGKAGYREFGVYPPTGTDGQQIAGI